VAPVRTRKLYFSEKLLDPNDPNSADGILPTVEGQAPCSSIRKSGIPKHHCESRERWRIGSSKTAPANCTHFIFISCISCSLISTGKPANEPFLPRYRQRSLLQRQSVGISSVRLRWTFATPIRFGDFLYHCHLLEHEDGGMMGLIRVEPMSIERRAQNEFVLTHKAFSTA